MSDGPVGEPGFDDPDFDDPAHDRIRELLSSARADTPLPADVAARLEAALAELTGRAAQTTQPEDETAVVPLRRRARLAPRLLAAAAVLVVAGGGAVGLTRILHDDGSDRAVSADSASPAQSAGGKAATGNSPAQPAAPEPQLSGGTLNGLSSLARHVPVLSTADFASDRDLELKALSKVERAAALADATATKKGLEDRAPATSSGGVGDNDARPGPTRSAPGGAAPKAYANLQRAALAARSCAGPQLDGVATYPIVLDGAPAVLVVHPANAGTKLVEAWSCDGSEVLAFTTVPD